MPLDDGQVPSILAAFDLGSWGRLSDGPVASGRLGSIWRLDTDAAAGRSSRSATSPLRSSPNCSRAGLPGGVARRRCADARGATDAAGESIADCGEVRVRLHAWVDLHDPDATSIRSTSGGWWPASTASTSRARSASTPGTRNPSGAARWSELVSALRARRAPFADELDALVPELIAMEAFLGGPPRAPPDLSPRPLGRQRPPHVHDGGLCVFDFDNAGLADPSQELALILVEYCTRIRGRAGSDPRRVRGGGRTRARRGPTDFAMPIAQLSHIVAEAADAGWRPRRTTSGATTKAGCASSSTGR